MLAWNVCGLGGRDKRRVLRNVIRKNNIDFICVLETKLEIVDEKIVNAVWGREHRSWYICCAFVGFIWRSSVHMESF
jgi:exonuclease III